MPKFTGDTVEEAIKIGLDTLQLNKADADVIIIEEAKKGFLGFGKKLAVVDITKKKVIQEEIKIEPIIKEEPQIVEEVELESEDLNETELLEDKNYDLSDDAAIEVVSTYLSDITDKLGAPSTVRVEKKKKDIVFHLESSKKGILIGKHGRTLNAVQYLGQVYIHRIAKNRLQIVVNVGDYRERRDAIMYRLAKKTLNQVRATGQPVFLEPMPAFERKKIHAILSYERDVKTHSEGNEPHRYLVVELKK